MPWSKPAARMREFILAIRAIWDTWETGGELDFEGDFYTHTLMAPFFNPGPNPHGNPKIMLAAVGPLMTETAGEVADGVLVPRLLDRALPARGDAAGARARLREGGPHARGLRDHRAGVRRRRATPRRRSPRASRSVKQQIAFYGSTPAYRPVLELHGWGELQDELQGDDQARRVGPDGGADRRRGGARRSRSSARPRRRSPRSSAATATSPRGSRCTLPAERDEERWRGLFDELRG